MSLNTKKIVEYLEELAEIKNLAEQLLFRLGKLERRTITELLSELERKEELNINAPPFNPYSSQK